MCKTIEFSLSSDYNVLRIPYTCLIQLFRSRSTRNQLRCFTNPKRAHLRPHAVSLVPTLSSRKALSCPNLLLNKRPEAQDLLPLAGLLSSAARRVSADVSIESGMLNVGFAFQSIHQQTPDRERSSSLYVAVFIDLGLFGLVLDRSGFV